MKTTAEMTIEYLKSHPSLMDCLVKGVINYSALAREISKEIGASKKSSIEAVTISLIRFREKYQKSQKILEKRIMSVISDSEFEIKNKISILIIDRDTHSESIINVEREIKKKKGIFYMIEGDNTITLVVQGKNTKLVEGVIGEIDNKRDNMSLIVLKSPETIEDTPGVVAYITNLFFQNGVNIYEIMSCWKDTLIVIDTKDIPPVSGFLNF